MFGRRGGPCASHYCCPHGRRGPIRRTRAATTPNSSLGCEDCCERTGKGIRNSHYYKASSDVVAIRPVARDASGVGRTTRDIRMFKR
jgi:hypothetical protein